MSDDLKSAAGRKLNFFQTIKAVLWSFIGLRRGADYREDASKLNPIYVIVAGLIMAVVFVVVLLLIVRAVVS
ncbi:MAG: DUF2970 domain-containing protein [Pigmentiphaga sp.]|uniref:DUF2970 domain-containing protein n=1 Tax=Pigmentiphaga sp. TaxID=1977564 RepID=UPI0029A24459|nr:DUF2970 domain-containing protein [Pigmentiphaga sp.]MDX3907965.1 DUF2970 domain-containing protein [Pigmentiphaga sp.]